MTTLPRPNALRTIAADIKLAHSVFALPFAVLAAVMAAAPSGSLDALRFAGQLVLVVVAMVFGRTFAMLANRYLDREIDAGNPRTAQRALPSGRLSVPAARGALATCALLFIATAAGFGVGYGNWWPAALSVPVLLWVGAYGWCKRFTALCHVYLGSSLAISPLAAALAIDPAALTSQPALWWMAVMVLGWVAGFDVIYALQDVEVDRRDGLHSMPARFGVTRALWISRALHLTSVIALAIAVVVDARFGVVMGGAVVVIAGVIVAEHATVQRWGTGRLALAFFTLNGIVSCVLGACGVVDVLL